MTVEKTILDGHLDMFKKSIAFVDLSYTVVRELPEGLRVSIEYTDPVDLVYFGEHFGLLRGEAIAMNIINNK